MNIPNNSLTLCLAFQIDLQNKGQRDGAQISRSRAQNSDHGNPPRVSFSGVNVGSNSNVTLVGVQHGGSNLNVPKKE